MVIGGEADHVRALLPMSHPPRDRPEEATMTSNANAPIALAASADSGACAAQQGKVAITV